MRGFMGLTKRNLLVYFKDIQAIIFSMLTSIILLVLYLLFLKSTFVDSIQNSLTGLEDFVSAEQVGMLVNGILLTGVIGSALITISYHCLQTVVNDRDQKVDYDILATPISRSQIILAYFVASVISAFLVCGLILTVGLLVLSSMGRMNMGILTLLQAYGTVFLGAVSATAFFMPIMLLFKSSSASGAFFGMLSAAAGFVIGAYIPISQFSQGVQTVCDLFPGSHITILMRNHIMNGILEDIDASIGGIDHGAFVEAIRETFTFQASLFGEKLSTTTMVLYVGGLALVCIGIMIWGYSVSYKRK